MNVDDVKQLSKIYFHTVASVGANGPPSHVTLNKSIYHTTKNDTLRNEKNGNAHQNILLIK